MLYIKNHVQEIRMDNVWRSLCPLCRTDADQVGEATRFSGILISYAKSGWCRVLPMYLDIYGEGL